MSRRIVPRRGPRPLLLHLTLAMARGMAALRAPCSDASPNSSSAWPLSKPGRREADRIVHALAAGRIAPEAFRAAIRRQLRAQDEALLAGLAAYRRQPALPTGPAVPTLWREGGSRLQDYGPADGVPALFVPSLVNRAHILDLMPAVQDGSMLRWLARHGVRPLLLDWGAPGEVETRFGLTDYVAGRLERALAAAVERAGRPVLLVGYCMGGLLALAAAQRRPDRVRGLALLATPWDFWAEGEAGPRGLAATLPTLEPLLAAGPLPVDTLQALFAAIDPFGIAEKYRAFAALDPTTPRARRFVALEDWLNDGIPLVAGVTRETLGGWYGENTPARGTWRIAGLPVQSAAVRGPRLVAVPDRDRLVPPASALALARRGATLLRVPAGHIGMVAGEHAAAGLWRPLAEWARRVG